MEKDLVGTCISVRRGHVKVGSSRGHASRTFRMDSMETLKSTLTVRTLVVPTRKGCQDSQTLIRCLNQAKDCSDLLPSHRWKQLKLHVRKLKSTVMGERLPWMSSDPETTNEEGYRLQMMKTSLRDQKYSFLHP